MEVIKMVRLTIVCISFIIISLMLAGVSNAKINKKNIMGMWLFDEGEGDTVKDYSENGNDGVLTNEPEWVDGQSGGALEFDGRVNGVKDHVLCGRDASINEIADAITITAWVYPMAESNYEYIVSNDRDCCGQYKGYSLSLGYTAFQIWDTNSASHRVKLAGKPSLKQWCHLAGTFDGKQLKIYLDGKLSNTAAFDGKIGTPATYEFAIGAMGYGQGAYNINGIIDEVAVFNVALSDNDIESIMTRGLEKATGLTAVSPSGKLATSWGDIKK
jgi:hypothetical protein